MISQGRVCCCWAELCIFSQENLMNMTSRMVRVLLPPEVVGTAAPERLQAFQGGQADRWQGGLPSPRSSNRKYRWFIKKFENANALAQGRKTMLARPNQHTAIPCILEMNTRICTGNQLPLHSDVDDKMWVFRLAFRPLPRPDQTSKPLL